MKKIPTLLILICLNIPSLSAQDYLIPAADGPFWGYLNKDQQWIIPARFEEALPFVKGMGCVKYYGKWGFIDKQGEWKIDPEFEKAKPFSEQLASVKSYGMWGFIDQKGSWAIDPKYLAVSSFSEGLAVVYNEGGFSYINKKGEWAIDKKFNFARPFTEGLASVIQDEEKGYIDFTGRFVIHHNFEKADAFAEGLALVAQNNKYGYINHRGDVMIPLMFKNANHFSEGKASVKIGTRWGYIDKSGELIIEARYDYAGHFIHGVAVVRQGKQYGMINDLGTWIIEPVYKDLNEMGKTISLEEEIIQQVESRIRQWEKKGEFEKTSEYLARVTVENRDLEVKTQTRKVVNELASRYIRFDNMELGLYNADAEMFTLYIPGMMSSLIPVPIQEAVWFKDHWDQAKILNPEFAIHDDQFVLTKFEAGLDKMAYEYDAYRHGIYISNFGGRPQLDNIQISLPELPIPLDNNYKIVSVGSGGSEVDEDIPVNDIEQDYIFSLVIGNEDYVAYQVGMESSINVDYAENDARIFNEYLRKTLGVPDENITLLINATAGQIKQALAKMTALAKAYDGQAEFIFYYAGHGLPDEKTGEPYLMPVDVASSDLAYAIPLQEVYETFTDYQSGKVTLFLDACFSGGARNEALLASRGIRIRPKSPFVMGNLIVYSASSGDQTAYAYDEKSHGMFTYHLLKKIQETRGMVPFGELADYLEKEVNRRSLLVNNREQEPMVKVSPILEYTWRNFSFIHQGQVFNE
jgi:hypothetical protein